MDFARKVIEQRIDCCLIDGTLVGENEEELVTLYSTLLDEDDFDLVDDDTCSPKVGFLVEAEKQLAERGTKPAELECFNVLKEKILVAVKKRKLVRRSRIDSVGRRDSVGSNSSLKRGLKDQNGRDCNRAKLESK